MLTWRRCAQRWATKSSSEPSVRPEQESFPNAHGITGSWSSGWPSLMPFRLCAKGSCLECFPDTRHPSSVATLIVAAPRGRQSRLLRTATLMSWKKACCALPEIQSWEQAVRTFGVDTGFSSFEVTRSITKSRRPSMLYAACMCAWTRTSICSFQPFNEAWRQKGDKLFSLAVNH